MAGVREALVSLPSLMRELVFYYVYPFFKRVGKSIQVDILGSKKLLLLIENIVSTFVEDQWLYRNEIYSKALAKKLEPILCSSMVYLNIFRGRCCDICLAGMSFCLFEFMFILHFVYFQISKIIFCSKHKKEK